MSALTVAQSVAVLLGLKKPLSLVSNTEPTAAQLLEYFQECGLWMASQYGWGRLETTVNWTGTGVELQGTVASIFGAENLRPENMTIWDTSRKLPVYPFSSRAEAQQTRIFGVGGSPYRYDIKQESLYMYPAPANLTPFSAVVKTKNWVLDGDTSAPKTAISKDTDTFIYPEEVMKMALRWYWRMSKNLPMKPTWETMVMQAIHQAAANQEPNQTISLTPGSSAIKPGIFVPLWATPKP